MSEYIKREFAVLLTCAVIIWSFVLSTSSRTLAQEKAGTALQKISASTNAAERITIHL